MAESLVNDYPQVSHLSLLLNGDAFVSELLCLESLVPLEELDEAALGRVGPEPNEVQDCGQSIKLSLGVPESH